MRIELTEQVKSPNWQEADQVPLITRHSATEELNSGLQRTTPAPPRVGIETARAWDVWIKKSTEL